jgi:hypothetical protein
MLGEPTASIAHEVNRPLAAVADARRACEMIAHSRHGATRRVPERTLLSLDGAKDTRSSGWLLPPVPEVFLNSFLLTNVPAAVVLSVM